MENKINNNPNQIKMEKAILFARVSTREQAEEGYSLPAQEKLLEEYASRNNFLIVKRFSVPESASGKQERKLFNELLKHIDKNKKVKIVLCEKVDRITRNFNDAVRLDEWLNKDNERQVHFVKQNLIIHKNSRSNEFFQWDIYLALARQYSNNLSEETKKGLYEKAEQGWFPGNKKRGYKTIGDIGQKIWVKDEDISDHKFIEIAFVLYDTGNYTLRTLVTELINQGWTSKGKPAVSISELHRLLSDPFYCGEFIFGGKHYKKAKHEPLISKELFYRVQERLQRKIKAGKYKKHLYLFGGGLITCGECGRTITFETQKGHYYGRCTKHNTNCSQKKYVREEKIDEQVKDILDSFKIDNKRILEWVRKALKEVNKDEKDYHADIMRELDNKRQKIEKTLDQLYEDRLDEKISKVFYTRNQEKWEKELDNVINAIEKHAQANVNYQKLGINIFELSQNGREIYEKKALVEEKRELLQFVFSNLYLKDGKVNYTAHNGFDVIAKRAKDCNWLRDRDLNPNFHVQSVACYHYTIPH